MDREFNIGDKIVFNRDNEYIVGVIDSELLHNTNNNYYRWVKVNNAHDYVLEDILIPYKEWNRDKLINDLLNNDG